MILLRGSLCGCARGCAQGRTCADEETSWHVLVRLSNWQFQVVDGPRELVWDNLGRNQAASGIVAPDFLLPTITHKFGEGIGWYYQYCNQRRKRFIDECARKGACQLWLMFDIAHYKTRGRGRVQTSAWVRSLEIVAAWQVWKSVGRSDESNVWLVHLLA